MINIAELLKDAPEGMKLYSPLFGEVKFVRVDKRSGYPIDVIDCKGNGKSFTEFGVYFANHPDAECLLFPSKECRTWEGWKLPVQTNFKFGDWVVRKDGDTFYGGNYAEQITLIEVDEKGKCIWLSSKTWVRDDFIRPWTIADAKDGDVLVCYSEVKGNPIEQAGIFKQYVGQHGGCSNTFLAHTGIDWDGNIIINGYMGSTNILPATKEQRDLLFAKMKEAGYEWDADKKELRKIQPHYDIANFQPFDHCRFKPTEAYDWIYADFWYVQAHYKVEHLSAIEKWES